ncbi:molybdopterin synthase small subunit CnxG [Kalaharituber pfeilii]|nr:molybdopterin synthase small subunit CnxG [Kalaharituber pfeilii]
MSTFKILYFAGCSSYTSRASDDFPAPLPISKLFPLLEEKYPGIIAKVLGSCLVTVNLEYVDVPESGQNSLDADEMIIRPGDEVAIIPPVSSG